MNTNNAQHRPHCVDVTPGALSNTGKPVAPVSRRPARNVFKTVLRKPSATSRSVRGAVRVNPTADTPRASTSHAPKLRAALAVIVAGIIWTTFQTDTSTAPDPQAATEPPAVVHAVMPTPNFFFDDAVDALTAHFSSKEELANLTEQQGLTVENPVSMETVLDSANNASFTTAEEASIKPVGFNDQEPNRQGVRMITPPQPVNTAPLPNHSRSNTQTAASTQPGFTDTKVIVAPGNTLSGILNDHGINIEQMPQLLANDIVKQDLSNLTIGQTLNIQQSTDGQFHSLTARVGDSQRISIRRLGDDYTVTSVNLPIEKERVVTSGTIQQSLYLAAEEAQLKQSTIMELADIFQWELDFARDIRKGDQFSLVYDRLYRDGRYVGDGDILAAEFIRGGKAYRAIRFTTDDGVTGYYSPDGKSKRRTFMRHPVDVVRITSKFNPNRLHPVLHQIRAHRGVDYGSPIGSPIYATADGKVKFSGVNGAYGKTVVLQHGQKFSTLYAHMSKIASKSVKGARVKQGDVIGYVGKTGRVTGAHLHYEFRVNGKQIDPLAVELPAAQPIAKKYLPELKALADEMTAQMRSVLNGDNQQVASVTDVISPRALQQPIE